MKHLLATVSLLGALVGLPTTAAATNYVLYAQGRGNASWSSQEKVNVAGTAWVEVVIAYDGGASMNGPATTTLRTQLEQKCASSTGNTCVVVCHSAGCMRLLKAVQDSSVTMFNIARVSAAGSAAGGTKIAQSVTSGSLKSIAKLVGQQEAVDWDLTPSVARGSFGYIQNAMNKTSGTMFHYAGYKDTCVSFLFFKQCGNKYVNSGLTGARGDGLVSYDSAGGASSAGAFNNLCSSGGTGTLRITTRYAKRAAGTGTPCDGENRDHSGIVGSAVKQTEVALPTTPTGDKNLHFGDATSQAVCSDTNSSCGQAFTDPTTDQSILKNASNQPVTVGPGTNATSSQTVGDTSSATSCAGRCGLYQPGRACQCDGACASGGDCCADYAASNCPNVVVW